MSDIGSRVGDDVLVGRFFQDDEQQCEGYILDKTAGGYYLIEILHRDGGDAHRGEQRLVTGDQVIHWRFFSDAEIFLGSPPDW